MTSPIDIVRVVRFCLKDGHQASSPCSIERLAFVVGAENATFSADLADAGLSVGFLSNLSQEPVMSAGGLVVAAARCLAYATSEAERAALCQLIAEEELGL